MMTKSRYLFLMVARGGSKSIKDKNLQVVGGKSLINWRATTAKASGCFDRLIVSTDSEVIASEAKACGIEVPFIRPSELATDTASSVDVVLHALNWMQQHDGSNYDGVFLAEPSSPFCRVVDIRHSVEMFEASRAELVASVVKSKVNTIHISEMGSEFDFSNVSKRIGLLPTGNRQQHEKQYYMNGCVYLFKPQEMIENRSIFPLEGQTKVFEMPEYYSIEIDEPSELELARFYWETRKVDATSLIKSEENNERK